MGTQMEDKDIYGFWFFGWNPLSFSMWLVFVWDNRVRGFNDKGQSFLVEFFTDIHFSPIFWLLICDLFVILQSLFMKMSGAFAGCNVEKLHMFHGCKAKIWLCSSCNELNCLIFNFL